MQTDHCGTVMCVLIATEIVAKKDNGLKEKLSLFQMGKIRLFIYSVFLGVMLFLVQPLFLYKEGINEELKPYWDNELVEIEKTCGKQGVLPQRILVDFGDTEDAIGYCQRLPNGFKIIINKNYWNKRLDQLGKRQLLLHEMMHCIFKVSHNLKDANHFMYPEYSPIKEEELLSQVAATIKESGKCN